MGNCGPLYPESFLKAHQGSQGRLSSWFGGRAKALGKSFPVNIRCVGVDAKSLYLSSLTLLLDALFECDMWV